MSRSVRHRRSGLGLRRAALRLLALWLIGAISASAVANDSRSLRFQHLSRDEGLSQSYVYAIAQDQQGYMWFGTQEGLNRFDGFDFTLFAHDPDDPGSISDESIRTIYVDRSGTLWVGTDAGGLSRYDEAQQTFTNYLHDPEESDSIASNRVRTIYEDREGRLWVGTDGAGLDRFDRETGRFEHFEPDPADPNSLAGAQVWSIVQSSDGPLWIGTDNGLSRLNLDKRTFVNYRNDPNDASTLSHNHVRTVFEDADNVIWIGTESGGLNKLNRHDGTFERFMNDPDDPSSISANRINAIYQDDVGVIWIGTIKGLNAWNPLARNFDRYFHDPNSRYSLSHDSVLSVFQDRGNVLWVGTYDGLNCWNSAGRAMLHYRHDADDPNSLSENTVTTFAEDSRGDVWVGTFGGGLNQLDRTTKQFRQLRHDPEDSKSVSSDRVMALHVDRHDVLWAGTRDAGLNRYSSEHGTFTRYRHNPDDTTSLSADGVTYILEHSDEKLWIATFGGGLNVYEPESDKFQHYRHNADDPSSLSSDRVLVLFEDSDNYLWAGTYGGGLNRFDPATGEFTQFRAEPDKPDGLGGDEIYMIQEDTNGDFWIGVKAAGLYRWRHEDRTKNKPTFQRFTEINGLPDATIYGGEFDAAGHLWLSSARGLSRFAISDVEFRNYNTGHGLQGDEFNLAASFRASDGILFFGGMNGFNAFQPSELDVIPLPPPVAITRFLSQNEPVDLGHTRVSGDPVDLRYNENVVGFEFAALDYAAPQNNRFMYKLEGLDENWVDADTNRQVTYTNLPAGDYKFLVKAANNDGVWSEHAAALDIRINRAPWKTWWAYASYLLALTLLAAYWTRNFRAQQTVKREYTKNLQVLKSRLSEAQRIGRVGNWDWNVSINDLWWSDEAYRLFQIKPDSFSGTYDSFLTLVHPEDREAVSDAVYRALEGQEPLSIDHRIVRRDGTERVIHQRAEVTFNQQGHAVRMAGTINDITERKTAEDNVYRRASFQNLLAKLSADLIRAQPGRIEPHLDACLRQIADRYELDAISIKLNAQTEQDAPWVHQWLRDDEQEHGRRHPFSRDQFAYRWINEQILAGDPFSIDDVEELPVSAVMDRRELQRQGIKSLLAVPLLRDDELEGQIVFLTRQQPRSWCDQTVAELKLIADNLSGAIARSRAVAEIKDLKDQLQEENIYLREEVRIAHGFDEIIGEDAALHSCLRAVEKVAPTDVPVLILGETGTGKELIARAIHKQSQRSQGPFVSVNCPALPENLIESELFGHEKGAFTGAHSKRKGRFELAKGGTLFLDELGELPLELQVKLLRVLQTGDFERLGGLKTLHSDVRLIAATNRNLKQAIGTGEFRADLYYRINTFPISLPALRDRKGDIPILAKHFVHKHAGRHGKRIDTISSRMLKELETYSWPGNIRELENTIERAIISTEKSSVLHLPGPLRLITALHQSKSDFEAHDDDDLFSVERSHIVKVLEQTGWKVSGPKGASAVLGIPSSTLRSKMKRYGITRPAG